MRTHTTNDGRVFTLAGIKPYTRKDGTTTNLAVWRTPCAHPGCTGERVITVPEGTTAAKAFALKHCRDHAITTDEFFRRGREALRAKQRELSARGAAAKRRLTDQDVSEIRASARGGMSYGALALCYPASKGTIREIVAGRRR